MSKRKYFIGGNWKCNGTCSSVEQLLTSLKNIKTDAIEVVVAPPNIHVRHAITELHHNINVAVQNISKVAGHGAYTGELTAEMARDSGASWAIIGHSERRHKFEPETENNVALRARHALKAGLNVIYCVGETASERAEGKTKAICKQQLDAFLLTAPCSVDNFVIAYEPVWAIGTGQAATPEQVEEAHEFIRSLLCEIHGEEMQSAVRVIYGGSVKPNNCKELIECKNVDGFLIGGASLVAKDFASIIDICKENGLE